MSITDDPSASQCSGEDHDLEITAPSGVEDVPHTTDEEELLLDGAKVGRYTVLTRVGSGGMGVVYSAFDPELDRKVALKVMHQHRSPLSSSVGGKERLLREAQAMAKISHPNVITVHDVGTYEDRVFIAMEFIDGPTLRAWLGQGPHEWGDVVEIFVRAGRGLAAAHAGGLVHRDFKPDNVLIGRGGRVLVMDFGLARQASSRVAEAQPTGTPPPSNVRNVVLTRTGALVGTPAYMAPEQHKGSAADPRVDQFSFCVALYEALYGERPFAGNSLASLAINVLEGQIRPPPKGSQVPAWLRAVVLRGLSVDRSDRFPSMDALLAELQRDPPDTGRPWLTAAVALGVGTLLVGTYLLTRGPDEDRCVSPHDRLSSTWGPAQRDTLREVFSATSLSFADTSGQSTVRMLDAWSARWSEQWVDQCHAAIEAAAGGSFDPQAQPEIRCLDLQRRDLEALVARMIEADDAVVLRAPRAASAMPEPARCQAVEVELSISDRSPPSSSDERERLAQLHTSMAQGRALLHTGAPDKAARIAEALVDSAVALSDPGLEAEAGLLLARAHDARDDPGRAKRQLRKVMLTAAAGRRPGLEADAWTEMVTVVGERLGQHDEGHHIALAAEAAIVRAHDPPGLRAQLGAARAGIQLDRGRYDDAREHLERTLERLQAQDPPPPLLLADTWHDLGVALDGLSRFEEALAAHEHAQSKREQVLGAQHPLVGATLARLGGTMLGLGLLLQADATFVRARWILDPTHFTDDPEASPPAEMSRWQRRELATVLDRQGLLQRNQEEPAAAEALHRRALALLKDTLGPSHRDLGYPLVNLGLALTEQQAPLDAMAYLRRALEIWSTELDPEHPDLGTANLDLANTLWALGEHDKARKHYAEALRIWEELLPDDHPLLAYPLTGLGRCDLALDATASAIDSLERAYTLRDHEDEDRLNLAETSLVLARALWKQGEDLTRALDLAVRARDLAGAIEPRDSAGMQRMLAGGAVPKLTDQLVPAGLGALNRNTRSR
ncbi:MAG: serine/threonine-protein kinase [Myxococcota bacterium]